MGVCLVLCAWCAQTVRLRHERARHAPLPHGHPPRAHSAGCRTPAAASRVISRRGRACSRRATLWRSASPQVRPQLALHPGSAAAACSSRCPKPRAAGTGALLHSAHAGSPLPGPAWPPCFAPEQRTPTTASSPPAAPSTRSPSAPPPRRGPCRCCYVLSLCCPLAPAVPPALPPHQSRAALALVITCT